MTTGQITPTTALLVHGIDDDGTVTATYPVADGIGAERMLMAMLELHPKTELYDVGEGQATRLLSTADRETFYGLAIKDTTVPSLIVRLGRLLDWLVPHNNIEHLYGPDIPLCLRDLEIDAERCVLRAEVDIAPKARPDASYVRLEYGNHTSRRYIATIRTAGDAAETWLIARICYEFLCDQSLEWRVKELGIVHQAPSLLQHFAVTDRQRKRIDSWLKVLTPHVLSIQKSSMTSGEFDRLTQEGTVPYYGACGGGLSYTFTPTGLGTIVNVTEAISGTSLDVTDYADW